MPRAEARKLRTRGLVLRRFGYGEADRILLVLTETYGKMRLVLRGVRGSRGRRTALTEPGSEVDLLISAGSSLPVISEGTVIRGGHGISADLPRLGCALHILELIDRCIDEQQPLPEVYRLAAAALRHMENAFDPGLLTRGFEMKLLTEMGDAPAVEQCAACGSLPLVPLFHPTLGGLLCAGCTPAAGGIPLQARSFSALRRLPHVSLAKLASARPPAELCELERCLAEYLEQVLDRPLHAAGVMRELGKKQLPGRGGPAP